MKDVPNNYLPLELSYTVPKPFFTDSEQAHVELPPYFETDPRNGASNRSVPVHVEALLPNAWSQGRYRNFEAIEFTLYGAIKSQINNKVAVQKILYSTELRKWCDFARHQKSKNSDSASTSSRFSCDLVFSIGQSYESQSPLKRRRLMPSIDIRASKYITRSTALNDQHLIAGRCEVIYCVEARLISRDGQCHNVALTGSGDITAQSVKSSVINVQPNPSIVHLLPPRKLLKGENGPFEVTAEGRSSSILRMKKQYQSLLSNTSRQVETQPKIKFSIQKSMEQSQVVTTSSGSTTSFTVPVAMTVSLPDTSSSVTADPGIDVLRQHLIRSGSPNAVTFTSTWHTKYKFTNSADLPSNAENTIESSTVRHDTRVLNFPPFYEISQNQYTATANLEIMLLAGMPPTSNHGLLKVQHFLSLAFEIGEDKMSILELSSHSQMLVLAGMTTKSIRVECLIDV